jgi:hypothetical protein
MSTLNDREAVLRRALRAAAEAVEPRDDGLERIQARLHRPRPLALAWAEAMWTDLRLQAGPVLHDWLLRLLSIIGLAWQRFGPRPRTAGGRSSRAATWLRPAIALGVTVFVVAAGAYVAINAQQAIFPSSSNSPHSTGGGSGAGGSSRGGVGSHAQSQTATGPHAGSSGKSTSPACAHPKPSGGAAPASSGTTGASQSTSPSSSPSGSPSGSTSPSPSVTGTSTANPTGPAAGAAGLTTDAPISPAGSASPGALASRAILTRSSVVNVTVSQCVKKRPPRSRPTATVQPSAQPAVVSFGKLNEGG